MPRPSVRLRRLMPADRETLAAYLLRDPSNNIIQLANLEQYGLDRPGVRFFGAFEGRALVGELMCFRHGGVCWNSDAALTPFAELLQQRQMEALYGSAGYVLPLLRLLPAADRGPVIETAFCDVTRESLQAWPARDERLARAADLGRLADFYALNLLSTNQTWSEHFRRLERTLYSGGMIALLERDGVVVSAGRVATLGYGMAMISSVVTRPAYRGQGFATACTGLLSRMLLDLGFTPHLCYDRADPVAARIYHRLGYQVRGDWVHVLLRTKTSRLPRASGVSV
jgi:GNAT superfamily N-acetyltransferase